MIGGWGVVVFEGVRVRLMNLLLLPVVSLLTVSGQFYVINCNLCKCVTFTVMRCLMNYYLVTLL